MLTFYFGVWIGPGRPLYALSDFSVCVFATGSNVTVRNFIEGHQIK